VKSVTEKWFGDSFAQLHPQLQRLHAAGGTLSGDVLVEYGHGIAGLIGKRLGRKLGLPTNAGRTDFEVEISHTETSMIWSRRFASAEQSMTSVFTPYGTYPNGYWTETTGALELKLAAHVQEGGWHWIQRETSFRGRSLPAVVLPALAAHKTVCDGLYRFEVGLSGYGLGLLLGYKGELSLVG